MVIKERYKRLKSLHNTEGFMLLEAVALVGFVLFVGIAASTLHGLIMTSYRSTENHRYALSYAENVLASALTGVPYKTSQTLFKNTRDAAHGSSSLQKNFFISDITKTRGAPFLPSNTPFMIIAATITWRERDQEKKIVLTRLVSESHMGL